jgi:preprotein translocase subunit YajC
MEKKNNVIILIVVLLVIIVLSVWLAISRQKNNEEPNLADTNNTNLEEGVVTEPGAENPVSSVVPTPAEIDVPADLDWREAIKEPDFTVEFMTDEEKTKIGIPLERRVQVLSRDEETGMILAYKIINSDDEIVTGPQE